MCYDVITFTPSISCNFPFLENCTVGVIVFCNGKYFLIIQMFDVQNIVEHVIYFEEYSALLTLFITFVSANGKIIKIKSLAF